MAAHSCRTTLKSLGGARTSAAIAAVKELVLGEESEHSDAALWFPLKPFHEDPISPEELLHSFHFLLLLPTFSYIQRDYLVNIPTKCMKKQKTSQGCSLHCHLFRAS